MPNSFGSSSESLEASTQAVLFDRIPADTALEDRTAEDENKQVVVVARHDDHLPLYRQEEIYQRWCGHTARSSMAQWVGSRVLSLDEFQ